MLFLTSKQSWKKQMPDFALIDMTTANVIVLRVIMLLLAAETINQRKRANEIKLKYSVANARRGALILIKNFISLLRPDARENTESKEWQNTNPTDGHARSSRKTRGKCERSKVLSEYSGWLCKGPGESSEGVVTEIGKIK